MAHPKLLCSTLFLLLLLLLTGGCSGYARDRLKDASEIVEFGVGISRGLCVNARATKVLQAGAGGYSGMWGGLREGVFCSWIEERAEFGVSPLYLHEVFRKSDTLVDIRHPLLLSPGYGEFLNDFRLITDRGFFEIGLTVNAIFIGIDAAVEPAEAVDFLVGIFGWDLLGDDAFSVPVERLITRLQSRNAWTRFAAARALRRVTGRDFGYTLFTVRDEHTEDQIQTRRRWRTWFEEAEGTPDGLPADEASGDSRGPRR
jgi:hypothetical protein